MPPVKANFNPTTLNVPSISVSQDDGNILDEFCFLSRWYYGACLDVHRCEPSIRIVLPGEPMDVCRCGNRVPICPPDPAPTLPPSIRDNDDDVFTNKTTLYLVIFTPLGVVAFCIVVLAIVAFFVGRHKQRWHEEFILNWPRTNRRREMVCT